MDAHRSPAPDETRGTSPLARAARLAAGWSLLAVGGALLLLPGPGIPVVLAGLAVLGREQRWARRLVVGLRARWGQLLGRRSRSLAPPPPA
jgi:hypothetical protein